MRRRGIVRACCSGGWERCWGLSCLCLRLPPLSLFSGWLSLPLPYWLSLLPLPGFGLLLCRRPSALLPLGDGRGPGGCRGFLILMPPGGRVPELRHRLRRLPASPFSLVELLTPSLFTLSLATPRFAWSFGWLVGQG
jgi:hypothetical protein